jgi:low molecular weight phosphotyrosine protein phosphatase
MAEGVFRSLAKANPRVGIIDSAGTGAYHTLEPPDYRTMDTLRKHKITDYDHGARKVTEDDMKEFDYIFAMDSSNLHDLQRIQRRVDSKGTKSKAQVMLFGEYSGKKRAENIEDPYYGVDNGFEIVYEQVTRFSKNFLAKEVDKTE